jgi:hypothetical protein
MDSEKLALVGFYAIIAAGLAIFASAVFGCAMFQEVMNPINEPCTSNELRCNGSTVQECTGRQWYDHFDCAKITKDGEPMPMDCVGGRCK